MKNIKLYLLTLVALVFVISSCEEEEELTARRLNDNPVPSVRGNSGSLDLSTYVAIGNSLTAGFADGALYTSAQDASFPNFLAQQFMTEGVGGGAFDQPDINSANGFSGLGPGGAPLGRFELSLSLLRPVPTQGELPTEFTGDKAGVNNMGVPGMRITDIMDPGFVARNPLYARFASAPGTGSVLDQALAQNPTFYTYWLGSNDALIYATGGGTDESLITAVPDFQMSLANSLGALANSGAQGVVVNIPPIVLAPFFRAVGHDVVPLDAATATTLNGAFAGHNQVLQLLAANNFISANEAAARQVSYSAGENNPVLMFDDALTDIGPILDGLVLAQQLSPQQRAALEPYRQARPATANDLPLLTAATEIGRVISPTAIVGVSVPIGDEFILSASEVVNVVTARATFNAVIDGVVAQINAQAGTTVVSVMDVGPVFADAFGLTPATAQALALSPASIAAADGTLGIVVDGVTLAPDFGPNGIISTDGIHPNPRGHAIIANAILDNMRFHWGSFIPAVNVLAQRGVITTD